MAALAEHPERFAVAREDSFYDLPFTVRQLLYGIGRKPTHRAVLEVHGDTVYVLAVRHLVQNDLSPDEL